MKGIIKELLGWLVFIFIVIAASWFVVTFIGQRTQVSGSSMETTLSHGDQLIVDKISYRFSDPKRYDIVVFPYHYEENTFYIKRIIGMPGETVQIVDGEVYIDGNFWESITAMSRWKMQGLRRIRSRWGMMSILSSGDNRNNSQDSRVSNVGVLHRDELLGRAWIRIWPFSEFGVIKHE